MSDEDTEEAPEEAHVAKDGSSRVSTDGTLKQLTPMRAMSDEEFATSPGETPVSTDGLSQQLAPTRAMSDEEYATSLGEASVATDGLLQQIATIRTLVEGERKLQLETCSAHLIQAMGSSAKPLEAVPLVEALTSLSDEDLAQLGSAMTQLKDVPAAVQAAEADMSGIALAAADAHRIFTSLPREAQVIAAHVAPSTFTKSTLRVAREVDKASFATCLAPVISDLPDLFNLKSQIDKSEGGLPKIDPELAVRLHGHFLELPPLAKRAVIQEAPPQIAPIVRAAAVMDADTIRKLSPRLNEFDQAAKAITRKGAPTGEQQEQRRQGVILLRELFLDMPAESRELLAEALPEQARPLAQMAAGLSENDVDELLNLIDKVEPASNSAGRATAAVHNRQTLAAAGKVVLRAETKRIWNWVRGRPFGLRVICFLIGLSLMVAGIWGMVVELLDKFRLPEVALEFHVFFFGFVICTIEVESHICSMYAGAFFHRYAYCLSTASGRGIFLVFVGVVSLSPWTNGISGIVNSIAAILAMLMGIAFLIISFLAGRKLASGRAETATSEQLRDAFVKADPLARGKLRPSIVVKMLASLDPPTLLNDLELSVAIMQIGSTGTGEIELEKLVKWWEGKDLPPRLTRKSMRESMKKENWRLTCTAKRTTWITRVVFVLVGVGYIFLGCMGIGKYIHEEFKHHNNRSSRHDLRVSLRIISMCTVFSIAVVVVLLEVNKNVAQSIEGAARLFGKLWGKSLLVMFLSTLALTQRPLKHEHWNVMVGVITYAIFCLICLIGCVLEWQSSKLGLYTLDEMSTRFDASAGNDGTLDTIELTRMLARMGVHLNRVVLEAALCELDSNGDGRIGKQEFMNWAQANVAAWARAEFKTKPQGAIPTPDDIEMAKIETGASRTSRMTEQSELLRW